jgi:hypothetical protein
MINRIERLLVILLFFSPFVRDAGLLNAQTAGLNEVIPFKYVRNKTILPVTIGNSRTLNIILDSGMGSNGLLIMNPALKDSVQLSNPVNAQIAGGGKRPNQYTLFADSMNFSIGSKIFSNQRIIILQGDSFKGFDNDGVTGYSLFGHYQVEINNDNNTISLHNFNNKEIDESWFGIPVYFNHNNIPWIDILVFVNEKTPVKLCCYIDYASSESIELLQKENQKFTEPVEKEEYYLGRGLSGDIYGSKGVVSKVIIGPYELKNVTAAFAPFKSRSKQGNADGIVANHLLRRFNLIFDYQNKKLYIKPNSHFNKTF